MGLAECALLTGDSAAAVALTRARVRRVARGPGGGQPLPVPGHRHPGPAGAARPDRRPDWAERVSADLLARGVPGMLPAVDHAQGLVELAAGRTGKARDLLAAAQAGWSARGRWWESQWCALDLARCAVASNRRTEAVTLVEGVREAASAVAAAPAARGGGRDRLAPRPARRPGALVAVDPP